MDQYKIPNIPVDDYLENHKECPLYEKACELIDKTTKRGIVEGAQVSTKIVFGVRASRKRTRLTVGKRFVFLHPVSGLVILFVCQEDVNRGTEKPVMWNCRNFILDT